MEGIKSIIFTKNLLLQNLEEYILSVNSVKPNSFGSIENHNLCKWQDYIKMLSQPQGSRYKTKWS